MARRLLIPEEVAEILGVPITTLYQWRHKRVGPKSLRVGRHLRYREADLETWLREQEQQDQSAA
jgi:excisionase family DNA binding protein